MEHDSTIGFFQEKFNSISEDPRFFHLNQNKLPEDWHMSYHRDKPENRDIYILQFNDVLLGKIKVYDNGRVKIQIDHESVEKFQPFFRERIAA